jgi:hypothetical protein
MKVGLHNFPPPEQDEASVEKLLFHPLVLRSAWLRVKSWYKAGEWTPEADLVSWSVDPDTHLCRLGEKLVSGTYRPDRFRRIPYPKKGGQLRHYTMPTVEDQVAFAVFGVLLAPFLEAWMPNFSFGNRWFRPLYRRRPDAPEEETLQGELFKNSERKSQAKWAQRDFSLSDRRMYQPYPRAYGMFRRVAHWTAAAMFDVEEKVDTLATDRPKEVSDYLESDLPKFVYREWWALHEAKRGYWVHLDLQLAYPSVRRGFLRQTLGELCAIVPNHCAPLHDFGISGEPRLSGYPRDVGELLSRPGVRRLLVERLLNHLDSVGYFELDTGRPEHNDALWIPPHAPPLLPKSGQEPDGLPTGLAVSGLLMNVYLSGFDLGMGRWLAQQQGKSRAAFLRFADDMVLIASEPELLLEGIDKIWDNLCQPYNIQGDGRQETFLSQPKGSEGTTNLRVSWTKVEPSSLSDMLEDYLRESGWQECSGCKRHCLPLIEGEPRRLQNWFEGSKEKERFRVKLRRHALRPDRLEPFVTFLVERLSGLGHDSLLDRFGQSATQRLTQLHEIVRLDITDQQVKEDTRLSFAANRLVRAWIDEDNPDGGRGQLIQIRRSVEIALAKAPWKFSLWRAAVQAAARRPLPQARLGREQVEMLHVRANQEAKSWLKKLLQTIAYHQLDEMRSEDGLDLDWREEEGQEGCWRIHSHSDLTGVEYEEVLASRRSLMLSALRTSFWRSLAGVVREVSALEVRLHPGEEERPDAWSSESWTFRAFAEEQIPEVLLMLASIDDWIEALYPEDSRDNLVERLQSWWWEVEALSQAVLACTPRSRVLEHLTQRSSPKKWTTFSREECSQLFEVDLEVLAGHLPITGALELIHRARPETYAATVGSPWLHLLLSQRTGEDGEEKSIAAAILEHIPDQDLNDLPFGSLGDRLALIQAFRIGAKMPERFCQELRQHCDQVLTELARQNFAMSKFRLLRIYEEARRLALSLPSKPPAESLRKHGTLHRVLWADPRRKGSRSWPEPAVMPAVGLPIRIVLAMLTQALEHLDHGLAIPPPLPSESLPDLPVWCFSGSALEILSTGRAVQLGFQEDRSREQRKLNRKCEIKAGKGAWEIPAHATFYLPWALGWIESEDVQDLWTHILLFQTAVDGSERALDAILDHGIGAVPLTERWSLRSRVPVPEEVWGQMDGLMRVFGFRSGDGPEGNMGLVRKTVNKMTDCLDEILKQQPVSGDDFLWERVDVRLELASSLEVPYGISRFTSAKEKLPFHEKLDLAEDDLAKSFTVRLGQIRLGPTWSKLPKQFPGLSRAEIQKIMKEVAEVLGPDSDPDESKALDDEEERLAGLSSRPDIIILPEVSIPRSEIRPLVRVASQQEVAIFAGLLWRDVPPAIRAHSTVKRTRLLANEALLAVPLRIKDDRGPALTRQFYIEKPIPSHTEHALAKCLSESGEDWRVLAGRRWYRFIHPSWGDFTVAICSDLIDSSPWAALRGEILHLLMCAYNQDVGLYESLTWTRAYENYVNVAAVNHGEYGGSMAWSPKRRRKNEVARLLGDDLSVTADVRLEVKELWKRQLEDQRERVVDEHQKIWRGEKGGGEDLFKSPPPGFPFRRRKTS